LLKRRNGGSRISPATALNKFCSIRTLNGVYTEFGIDPGFAFYGLKELVLDGGFLPRCNSV
ncbi:hypothetical protein ACTQ33_17125, partial [Candidatus Avoscillospira sp. LCP25S3_F1]|uniref:hypothetical protein n=1 Tax=Candidatus Avoscillospira sp. LCP25S3_F1 TaxID=3438825 RepID=UPI003F8E1239